MTDTAGISGPQLSFSAFLFPDPTNPKQAGRRSSDPILPIQAGPNPTAPDGAPPASFVDPLAPASPPRRSTRPSLDSSEPAPIRRPGPLQESVALASTPEVALRSHQLLSDSFPGSAPDPANGSMGACCACKDCSRLAVSTEDGPAAWAGNDQSLIVLDGVVPLGTGVDLSRTFQLHSNPYATKTIFLDFDGFDISSTPWENGGALSLGSFFSSFDTTALTRIQRIWQRVAEDFSPFDINVTTEDPGSDALRKSGSGDTRWGIRVAFTKNRNLLTGNAITNAGGGGTAYYNSFNWSTDDVALVFNSSEYSAAETASHEVGHALGLTHDGSSSTTYYTGHGSGATSWGTIMGAPFLGTDENLTQWSKGQYAGANNTQDDLAVITGGNGFSYAADDHGNSFSSATALGGLSFSSFGVIERNTDIDMFRFDTGAGRVSFDIVNASRAFVGSGGTYTTEYLTARGPNLDIAASLYRANGSLLQTFNPADLTSAGFSIDLDAGTYFLGIDGVGAGDPFAATPTGYTDYGSLGQYMLTGTVQAGTTTTTTTTTTSTTSTTSTPPPPLPEPTLLVITDGELVTTEAGGRASFQVGLSRAPSSDVVIEIRSSDPGEGIVRTNRLVFTAANWQTLQTVTIEGVDDTLVDGRQPYSILLSSASSDPAFDGLSGPTITAQNSDDDVATPPTSGPVTFLASAGALTSGVSYIQSPTVTGGVEASHASDNLHLAITEGSYIRRGGTAITLNAYQWSFDNLREATQLVFEGYRNDGSNDDFKIEFSTNGGRKWTTALIISNTSESTFTYTLPTPVSGSMLVRARDTRTGNNDGSFDTLYVDRLVLVGSAPAAAGNTLDSITGSTDHRALDAGHDHGDHGACGEVLPEDLTISATLLLSAEGLTCCGEADPTPSDPLAPMFPAAGSDPTPWLTAGQTLLL